jgi:hypothetical protein
MAELRTRRRFGLVVLIGVLLATVFIGTVQFRRTEPAEVDPAQVFRAQDDAFTIGIPPSWMAEPSGPGENPSVVLRPEGATGDYRDGDDPYLRVSVWADHTEYDDAEGYLADIRATNATTTTGPVETVSLGLVDNADGMPVVRTELRQEGAPFELVVVEAVRDGLVVRASLVGPADEFDDLKAEIEPYLLTLALP